MAKAPSKRDQPDSRRDLISSITSPLALFALIALVIEGILGSFAARAIGSDFTALVYGMIGSFVLLIVIVAILLVVGGTSILESVRPASSDPAPDAIRDQHFAFIITLAPPEDIPGFRLDQIIWNSEKCYVRCANTEAKVKPAFGAGAAFQVRLPPAIVAKASDTEPIELELYDAKGNLWRVRPFFLAHRSVALSYASTKQQIVASYGGAP